MALKDWLDTGKCMLGFHQGEWVRTDPASCVLIQSCERCRTINQRVEHEWPDWRYRSEADCALERSCNRCAEIETRVEHQWGTWQYRSANGCEQGIQCNRCAIWCDEQRIEHAWGEWRYEERYRAPLHACVRCAILASYFPEQSVEPVLDHGAESALENLQELPSDDDAVATMLERAQAHAAMHSSESEPTEAASDWQKHGLEELRRMYEEQVQSGVISAERRPLLNALLAELDGVIQRPGSTLAEKQINARRLQDAMLRLGEALLEPSRGKPDKKPHTGTRLALIVKLHNELYRYVYNETASGDLTGEEGRAGMALMGELRDSREALADLPADGDPLKLESETLRQTVLNIRNFSLRHHLMLISPIWPTHSTAQKPSALFYSGGDEVGEFVERACADRKLQQLILQSTGEPASLRWNQLREAALGVFDFTGFKRNGDLAQMSAVANVAYELGIALALGRPAIIVAFEDQDLPSISTSNRSRSRCKRTPWRNWVGHSM
jgi:Pyruvate/2-oxoacid:ferredoxin oxidoreductase delta subunit